MPEKTILVVDDEPEIVQSVSRRLMASGYNVIVAMDGHQATTQAMKKEPDLIILDIGMPAGNGFEVAKRLRQDTRTCTKPIIILSARSSEEDYAQAMQEGVTKFMTKPFEPDELLAAVAECLRQSEPAMTK